MLENVLSTSACTFFVLLSVFDVFFSFPRCYGDTRAPLYTVRCVVDMAEGTPALSHALYWNMAVKEILVWVLLLWVYVLLDSVDWCCVLSKAFSDQSYVLHRQYCCTHVCRHRVGEVSGRVSDVSICIPVYCFENVASPNTCFRTVCLRNYSHHWMRPLVVICSRTLCRNVLFVDKLKIFVSVLESVA